MVKTETENIFRVIVTIPYGYYVNSYGRIQESIKSHRQWHYIKDVKKTEGSVIYTIDFIDVSPEEETEIKDFCEIIIKKECVKNKSTDYYQKKEKRL